jgi:hypothetical protein
MPAKEAKCDEKCPVCENFDKKGLEYRYEIQLNFLDANPSGLRSSDAGAMQNLNPSVSYSRIQFVESANGPPKTPTEEESRTSPVAVPQDYPQGVTQHARANSIEPPDRLSGRADTTPASSGISSLNVREARSVSAILGFDSSLRSQAMSNANGRDGDRENLDVGGLRSYHTNFSPLPGSSTHSTPTLASDSPPEAYEVDLLRYYRYVIAPRVCQSLASSYERLTFPSEMQRLKRVADSGVAGPLRYPSTLWH